MAAKKLEKLFLEGDFCRDIRGNRLKVKPIHVDTLEWDGKHGTLDDVAVKGAPEFADIDAYAVGSFKGENSYFGIVYFKIGGK